MSSKSDKVHMVDTETPSDDNEVMSNIAKNLTKLWTFWQWSEHLLYSLGILAVQSVCKYSGQQCNQTPFLSYLSKERLISKLDHNPRPKNLLNLKIKKSAVKWSSLKISPMICIPNRIQGCILKMIRGVSKNDNMLLDLKSKKLNCH